MYSLGLCTGASTITLVGIEKTGIKPKVDKVITRMHEGNPEQVIKDLLAEFDLTHYNSVAVTGRRYKEFLNLPNISEPLAVEYALKHVNGKGLHYNAVISAGGETFMVYTLDNSGKITKVFTGNKCASGTGEFFLQQTRRMDVTLDEAIKFSENETPYFVSGRCSVFCKSDCTHATNKGVPKGQVVAGLSQMMANKVLELLKNTPKENIMIVGGTTRIKVMMDYLEKEINNLTIPKEAVYFEALGAALWALENQSGSHVNLNQLFTTKKTQFDYHQPLRNFEHRVTFKHMDQGIANEGDHCILGLDVGSTTTKIVLLRESDNKIIISEYLRTNGNPVAASRKCYQSVLDQLNGTNVVIRGIGVTGSGRKIAGLHALTDGIINEIIAHAVAAVFFDPEVDTIFEIGGQDAKYTYITNGVASDYAMNEACSAGTGSFLEESAKETLAIETEDIADWALRGNHPPNFNDQCAAFISSDIKNTIHEGIPKEDIVAGLVYSICMNYVNRVKGARPVGKKVFMQGGVCYNRAIPMAMAALSGKEIIVPPEPGLMGSFGVALEVKNRIDQGLMDEKLFDLKTLSNREVEYKASFKCAGGKEKCDLGCSINRIFIENRTYPFGGACNLYYNIREKIRVDAGKHDLVVLRQQLVFDEYAPDPEDLPADAPTVGISRSFLTGTYYPLFAHFFKEVGFRPVLAEKVDPEGIDMCSAPFCYPCEISHGFFKNLLDLKPDFVFMPHISGTKVTNGQNPSKTCPLIQGEQFYLKQTFENRLQEGGPKILTPYLDLSVNTYELKRQFLTMAMTLGVSKRKAGIAFIKAWTIQSRMQSHMIEVGKKTIQEIEQDPTRIGVVLFGRPYNAFVPEANKGIPHKFASRGVTIIPVDFLDLKNYPVRNHMYWSMGQINLKGALAIKDHPQLFGTYITNFSCGPDSFVVGYFRDILGTKPSLTLELDNHTADAGLETRIEAFLDIVARYRKLLSTHLREKQMDSEFHPAVSKIEDNQYWITTSEGEQISLFDPRVRVVFGSMNQFSSQAIAATYISMGVRSLALPPMNEEHLKIGRGNSTCKECLPLQLTTGALIKYVKNERTKDEVTVYFMPSADGPCRFGQYQDFMIDLIRKQKIKNVTFLSMSSKDGYAGLGNKFVMLTWNAIIISDIFEDIHNAMMVIAEDPEQAHQQLMVIWKEVIIGLEGGAKPFRQAIIQAAKDLKNIPQAIALEEVPQILIVGEIYVRKEGISRRWLPERLAQSGIVSHVAPIHEWVYYIDWLIKSKLLPDQVSLKKRLSNKIRHAFMVRSEREIKSIMAKSGWYIPRFVDVDHVIETAKDFISPKLLGEAILTVGGPLAEVGKEFCGSIAIGPFGCMPNRLSESILNLTMDKEHVQKIRPDSQTALVMQEIQNLPFLAIESDGNPFPQVIEARIETFIVQALRMNEVMMKYPNRDVDIPTEV